MIKMDANGKENITDQFSDGEDQDVKSKIFEVFGDVTDEWAGGLSYERGRVQNLDGTEDKRDAGALLLSYIKRDIVTDEAVLKATNKIEARFDTGLEDKTQYLISSLIEGRVSDDLTIFTKIDWSETRNKTLSLTEAEYKEFVIGAAYRPLDNDRLNLLAKYSYIEDDAPVSQTDVSDVEHERFQVLAIEGIYDITDQWQVTEKFAYKWGEEKVSGFDFTETKTWLWVNRLGYTFMQDWNVAAEYRLLAQEEAQDMKHGALLEVTRNIGDFLQAGVGYNFTDFNDDLSRLDYTSQGPYVRVDRCTL